MKTYNQRKRSLESLEAKRDETQGIYQMVCAKGYKDEQLVKKVGGITGTIDEIRRGMFHRTKRQYKTKHSDKYRIKEIERGSGVIKKLKLWKTRSKGGIK